MSVDTAAYHVWRAITDGRGGGSTWHDIAQTLGLAGDENRTATPGIRMTRQAASLKEVSE